MRVPLTCKPFARYPEVRSSRLDAVTPETPTADAPPKPAWARGALYRGLVALPLVAGLATAGWLVAGRDQPAPVPTQAALTAPTPAQTVSGPSVLQASAPVQAQEPAQGAAGGGGGPAPLQKWADSLAGPLDIPTAALLGYANGELTMRKERPDCHLSWVTLAGLGVAGNNHGRGDGEPMGLSTQQWKKYGAQIPGIANPALSDPSAASVAAGRALCASGVDLSAGNGWWKAVAGYENGSGMELFRQRVLGYAQLYATLSLDPAKSNAPSVHATRFALGQLGLPYVWGGNGPDAGAAGFDCSGLTKASYDSAGVSLPRTADSQFRSMPPVPGGQEPQLGDLVFYGSPATRIHHVGLYLGNGLMINAPTEGQAIQIHTFHRPGDDYAGAGHPAN
ncbi:C40 family peptidase [Amycolatopsis rubida]|uniref:C40 family peptidase n=1 Tax=Amycolatopsis rubida TaxID=112413 RepID=A0ABX0CAL0_9PSEU|nr:NlpC/P60 family protein [Amycolatopsis rubida]NEC62462.1 C40 family peptidase [Amycolatopsis rubida]OAP22249.1 putative endopeptidase p60 precursor [Amycolatopsis sp. M39]